MGNGNTISVEVRIEGLSELRKLIVVLPEWSSLRELFSALVINYGDEVKDHLYNIQTGELGVFMVIHNTQMVRLPQQFERELKHNDEVFIISPLGGG